jgi:hypothetical protein
MFMRDLTSVSSIDAVAFCRRFLALGAAGEDAHRTAAGMAALLSTA